jgi:hypothetical protein
VSSRAALARHPLAIVGVVITTVSAAVFIALTVADATGLFANTYAGLVIFVALPALFVVGLLLIPAGMWLQRRKLRLHPDAAQDWPVLDFRMPAVRRTILIIGALTAVNIVIVLLAGYGTLHWMDSPSFCGQACHTPMHPQFTAWQNAPHSHVECTQCHIGEGARALVHYKLGGVRMLGHVVSGKYPRPIPASMVDLRPALETCGDCHTPTLGLGERTRFIHEYADDEANSETLTELQMHVGGPGQRTASGRAIHWHADPAVRVEFIATDAERQTIPFVRVTNAQGQVKEFVVEGTTPSDLEKGTTRAMDCVDCHNTVAHRIAPTAEQAVDRAIAAGQIDRSLPFVRREGVRLVKAGYDGEDAAMAAIESGLRDFYKARPAVAAASLERSIRGLQGVHRRNVFPSMSVTWGVYKDNLGHMTSSGCFRCHDGSHTAKDGTTISGDCEYCHKQIETPIPPPR